MEHNRENLDDELRIVGITVRTEESKAMADIGALWGQAHASGAITDPTLPAYGVYFDYESDHSGAYTVLVGQPRSGPVPDGLTEVKIPVQSYEVVRTEGAIPQVVQEAWQFINGAWEDKSKRSYRVDFERYEGSPQHSKLELWIGAD